MDSILKTVRKIVLGLPINSENTEEETAFDTDLIICINAAFSVLTQNGAGPKSGFIIVDDSSKWNDFIDDKTTVEMIKAYVVAKVRLAFDPPANSAAIEILEETVREYEWRIRDEYENYADA